jgi:hypothetical protein
MKFIASECQKCRYTPISVKKGKRKAPPFSLSISLSVCIRISSRPYILFCIFHVVFNDSVYYYIFIIKKGFEITKRRLLTDKKGP